jgi:hypothetical protein
MNTVFSAPLTRTLLAAGLAVAGTFASFTLTTTPAQAASAGYSAKLSAALAAPKQKVVNGVVWSCTGDSCAGPVDGARAVNTCVQVVKSFGKVSSFAGPKGELSAEDLQRCNAAA